MNGLPAVFVEFHEARVSMFPLPEEHGVCRRAQLLEMCPQGDNLVGTNIVLLGCLKKIIMHNVSLMRLKQSKGK